MTTYRVGPAGAVVHAADGRPLVRLLPGMVVVEGVLGAVVPPLDVPSAGEPSAGVSTDAPSRSRRRYDDKLIRPADDDKGAS